MTAELNRLLLRLAKVERQLAYARENGWHPLAKALMGGEIIQLKEAIGREMAAQAGGHCLAKT